MQSTCAMQYSKCMAGSSYIPHVCIACQVSVHWMCTQRTHPDFTSQVWLVHRTDPLGYEEHCITHYGRPLDPLPGEVFAFGDVFEERTVPTRTHWKDSDFVAGPQARSGGQPYFPVSVAFSRASRSNNNNQHNNIRTLHVSTALDKWAWLVLSQAGTFWCINLTPLHLWIFTSFALTTFEKHPHLHIYALKPKHSTPTPKGVLCNVCLTSILGG